MSTVARIDAHPPFKSVGLVCTCGTAVAGFEGVCTCHGCGAIYLISVLILHDPRAARMPAAETAEATHPTKGTRSSVA